ncbi:hypothetical protein D3C81_1237800 [compost metagenome]
MHAGEVENIELLQLRIGLARVAVEGEVIGPRRLPHHQDHQRLAVALLRLEVHHRVLADGLHHQVFPDAHALFGELADGIDVVGRVDEVGQLVFLAEDRRIGRIETARRHRHHQQAAEDHQHLFQQAAEERPVDHRQQPDQRRRQHTKQQQVDQQPGAEQRGRLAGIGFEDVLHHHRIDGDAVGVHEVGCCRRAQGDHTERRLQRETEGNQGQQQAERGPEEQAERSEERRAV